MNFLEISDFVRAAGFFMVCFGLLFRVMHWAYGNQLMLLGGVAILLGLVLNLIGGGWEMSSADEKIRLAGHMCILWICRFFKLDTRPFLR